MSGIKMMPDKDMITDLVERLAEAERGGDTAFLGENLVDDFVGTGPRGSCSRKANGSAGTGPVT